MENAVVRPPLFSERTKVILTFAVVGAGIYILYRAFMKFQQSSGQMIEQQTGANELEKLNNDPYTRQKLTPNQASAIANSIDQAMQGSGTAENVIYEQLRLLKNRADWLAVAKAYGTREVESGWYAVPNQTGTLVQNLQNELDSNERSQVNAILQKRNCGVKI